MKRKILIVIFLILLAVNINSEFNFNTTANESHRSINKIIDSHLQGHFWLSNGSIEEVTGNDGKKYLLVSFDINLLNIGSTNITVTHPDSSKWSLYTTISDETYIKYSGGYQAITEETITPGLTTYQRSYMIATNESLDIISGGFYFRLAIPWEWVPNNTNSEFDNIALYGATVTITKLYGIIWTYDPLLSYVLDFINGLNDVSKDESSSDINTTSYYLTGIYFALFFGMFFKRKRKRKTL